MPRGLNLKRIFRKQEELHPFKQFHVLNLLPADELREILLFSERELFSRADTVFEGKKIFFLHESGTIPLAEKILARKGTLLHYRLAGDPSAGVLSGSCFPVCGGLKPLSVPSDSFDAVVIPGASRIDRAYALLLPELVRGLKNGGRLLLTVIHPALELFLYNQNPASVSRARFGLEHYATALRDNQLYLESIREGVIDHELKPFLDQAEDFEELKGIPLVLYLRAVKYIKNGL